MNSLQACLMETKTLTRLDILSADQQSDCAIPSSFMVKLFQGLPELRHLAIDCELFAPEPDAFRRHVAIRHDKIEVLKIVAAHSPLKPLPVVIHAPRLVSFESSTPEGVSSLPGITRTSVNIQHMSYRENSTVKPASSARQLKSHSKNPYCGAALTHLSTTGARRSRLVLAGAHSRLRALKFVDSDLNTATLCNLHHHRGLKDLEIVRCKSALSSEAVVFAGLTRLSLSKCRFEGADSV